MPRLTKRKQAAVDREVRKKTRISEYSIVCQLTEDLHNPEFIRDSSVEAPGGSAEVPDLVQFNFLPSPEYDSDDASISVDLSSTGK